MKKVIIAGMIGNGLEWYDYMIYGMLASVISEHFFPPTDSSSALIAAFGIFAAGFLMRPIGAVLFGWIGDTYGRRTALAISIGLMAVPTAAIGVLPTYSSIGIAAPIGLTIIRLLQGLALGGEFSGAMTYVVEHAGAGKRSIVGSSTLISMIIGMLCAEALTVACAALLGANSFHAWGWRIPFVLGLFIGWVGFVIRHRLQESPVYEQAKKQGDISKRPVREVLSEHWPRMIVVIGLYLAATVPFYTYSVYMISYLKKVLGYSLNQALLTNAGGMLVLLLLFPLGAYISDRYGQRVALGMGCLLFLLVTLPAFSLISSGNVLNCLLGQMLLAVPIGIYLAPIPALLVEAFPTRVRYSGMALTANLAAALFGGTAPSVITWITQKTGDPLSVAWYQLASVVLSLVALQFFRERAEANL
jgi:MFS transporter, MHS family, proline/betaine transporter